MRRLGQDDALARNGGGDEGHVRGEAGALHFLYGVDGRDAENGGAAGAGLFDDAIDLRGGDEGADSVMDQDDFCGGVDLRERIGHGLLARIAAVNDAGGSADGGFGELVLEGGDIVGAGGKKKISDGFAGGEAAQGEDDERLAVEFEKLLRRRSAHTGAETSGRNDGMRCAS